MRVFQTFILPDDLVAKYKLSFAAANFSRNLLSGGGFDMCFSLIPVNVNGELPQITEEGYEVVYSDWRKKGKILAKLAIFNEQIQIFNRIQKDDSLWLYNLNVINSLLFILIKIFKPSVKLNVIILDFTPASNWRQQNHWYLKLINTADGAISLSYSNLFKCKKLTVLPGVVPSSAGKEPLINIPNKKFLLSGVLFEEIAQTSMVLEAFANMPQCELHITGKTDNEEMIRNYADRYNNINWHGALAFSDYMDLLHECTFVLSTRDPNSPENECNFPSKIIESLLHNRIIISTIEYKQLEGVRYFQILSQLEYFKESIVDITNQRDLELLAYANQGKKVSELFSTEVWNKAMTRIEKKICK